MILGWVSVLGTVQFLGLLDLSLWVGCLIGGVV